MACLDRSLLAPAQPNYEYGTSMRRERTRPRLPARREFGKNSIVIAPGQCRTIVTGSPDAMACASAVSSNKSRDPIAMIIAESGPARPGSRSPPDPAASTGFGP